VKSAIFYLSYAPGADRQRVMLPGVENAVYVRVEVVAFDEEEALDMANPRVGEHVMNSHVVEA
jgi:hypothetical protein